MGGFDSIDTPCYATAPLLLLIAIDNMNLANLASRAETGLDVIALDIAVTVSTYQPNTL